jgi:hypothetical protein
LDRPGSEKGRGAAHRNADDADRLTRYGILQELHRRCGVEALARTEGDVIARRLSMRLKVGRKHGEPLVVKKARASQHARSVFADAVKEQHGTDALAKTTFCATSGAGGAATDECDGLASMHAGALMTATPSNPPSAAR